MSTMIKIIQKFSFDEIMKSNDVEFLNKHRLAFEVTEEFEKCAKLRDKIKKLRDANNNYILE